MSFGDDSDSPWWDNTDEDVSDDARHILEERIQDESESESEEEEQLEEIEIAEPEDIAEELDDEEVDELEEIPAPEQDWLDLGEDEVHEDTHLVDESEIGEEWEKIHSFFTYAEAVEYCAPAPDSVLKIVVHVIDEDHVEYDIYRTDYEN
jgi:hypothetical protein